MIGKNAAQSLSFRSCAMQKPLLELRPRLTQYVKPGGKIMLSGILLTQVAEVQAAYEDSFEKFEVHTEELWALLTAVRKET